MSNRLDALLERMPRHFAREPDTNNYKLLKIIAQHSEDNRALYDTVLKYWDVDQAEGVGLDRLGKDEGISRGGWDDEEYRKMIKIQCIVNLSEGDIDVINLILDAYMGDGFIGIEEGWKFIEPASLLGHVKSNIGGFPKDLIKRIKPAGVKFYWAVDAIVANLIVNLKTYNFPVPYRICNTFQTDTLPGKLAKGTLSLQHRGYTFDAFTPICGTFVTSTINSVQSNLNVELDNEFRDVDVLYRRASDNTITGEGEI